MSEKYNYDDDWGCMAGCMLYSLIIIVPIFLTIGFKTWGNDFMVGMLAIFGICTVLTQLNRYDPEGFMAGFFLKDMFTPEANRTTYVNHPPKQTSWNNANGSTTKVYNSTVVSDVMETVLEFDPATETYKRVERKCEVRKRNPRVNSALKSNIKSKRYSRIAEYPSGFVPEKGQLKPSFWAKESELKPLPPIPEHLIVQKLERFTKQEVIDAWNDKCRREVEEDKAAGRPPRWVGIPPKKEALEKSLEEFKKQNPGINVQQSVEKTCVPPPPLCQMRVDIPPPPKVPAATPVPPCPHDSLAATIKRKMEERSNQREALLAPDGPPASDA